MPFLKIIIILLVLSVWAGHASSALEEDEAKAAERIERRQKVELVSFFENPKNTKLTGTHFSIRLYNEAVGHFQKQEYDLARQSLADSLKYDDQNTLAYVLLGDIEYFEQNLKAAKENYQIAYALQPSDGLKTKIEKLTKENVVEQKLSSYSEEHFIIKYQESGKTVEGYTLKEMLRQAYRVISQDFSFYFNYKIVVLLYDEKDFVALTNTPHWVGGLYDGKVRMPINRKGFDDREISALAQHELTHAFIAAMSNGRAPAWINEGLAVYQENKVRKYDNTVFNAAIKTHSLMALESLMNEKTIQTNHDSLKVALFYQQSFSLVQYLIGRYHMYAVKEMLTEFGTGKTSPDVIEDVLKVSIPRLNREWIESIGG